MTRSSWSRRWRSRQLERGAERTFGFTAAEVVAAARRFHSGLNVSNAHLEEQVNHSEKLLQRAESVSRVVASCSISHRASCSGPPDLSHSRSRRGLIPTQALLDSFLSPAARDRLHEVMLTDARPEPVTKLKYHRNGEWPGHLGPNCRRGREREWSSGAHRGCHPGHHGPLQAGTAPARCNRHRRQGEQVQERIPGNMSHEIRTPLNAVSDWDICWNRPH